MHVCQHGTYGNSLLSVQFFYKSKSAIKINPVYERAKETLMYRSVLWTLWGGGEIWENSIETCIISYKK